MSQPAPKLVIPTVDSWEYNKELLCRNLQFFLLNLKKVSPSFMKLKWDIFIGGKKQIKITRISSSDLKKCEHHFHSQPSWLIHTVILEYF